MIATPVRPVGLDTVDDAVWAVAREVELAGADYVYPTDDFGGCMYVDPIRVATDPPACGRCMIGRILIRAGVPAKLLADQRDAGDGDGAFPVNFAGVTSLVDTRLIELPQPVVELFEQVQDWQDGGEPWGTVLDMAREYADSMAALA
jgi:hypothetical protein